MCHSWLPDRNLAYSGLTFGSRLTFSRPSSPSFSVVPSAPRLAAPMRRSPSVRATVRSSSSSRCDAADDDDAALDQQRADFVAMLAAQQRVLADLDSEPIRGVTVDRCQRHGRSPLPELASLHGESDLLMIVTLSRFIAANWALPLAYFHLSR